MGPGSAFPVLAEESAVSCAGLRWKWYLVKALCEALRDQCESFMKVMVDVQGARIGVMRQIIDYNTSDPDVMALFVGALTTLQQQGDPLNLGDFLLPPSAHLSQAFLCTFLSRW